MITIFILNAIYYIYIIFDALCDVKVKIEKTLSL